jgi:uncharacterized surface protein with fasciclin (FAS1) repeats
MRKTTGIVAALAAAGLVAGAAAVPASAKGAKAPGPDSLFEIVSTDGRFTYLTAALEATGLDAAVDAAGVQYTVFAPTDAAFEKVADELFAAGVGDGTVPTLLGFLVANDLADDVLLYHVTEGRRWSNSVVPKRGMKSVGTLLGAPIKVTSAGKVVDASAATTDASIVDGLANISASNGVAHVIDNVLVPLA